EEYEQLSTAFPVGSIRNHISVLRIKQRDLYEQLGWTLPEGGAGHSSQKKTPKSAKKRNGDEDADDGDAVLETPSKKPRARKGNKDTASAKKEEGVEEVNHEVADTPLGVKQEEGVEDEI
ncbi:hypothetical protein COCHEDRAFT_1109512, partial [Bipolaris maydis C5]